MDHGLNQVRLVQQLMSASDTFGIKEVFLLCWTERHLISRFRLKPRLRELVLNFLISNEDPSYV
jgi:hypothetical protein